MKKNIHAGIKVKAICMNEEKEREQVGLSASVMVAEPLRGRMSPFNLASNRE